MDKLAKLTTDIGKLWETYSGAYFTGIRNTLVLAVVATLIGCVIGLMCGILNTIPYTRQDPPVKRFFLKLLLHKRSTDNRLIVSIALLFAFCGICAMLDVSPLLGCMSMGMVYINLTDDKRLFQQLNYFSPPILLLFFVRSGLNFDLDALVDNSESIGATPLVVVGILYFLVRIMGKYAGAFLGCLVTKKDKKVRNFLGLALIPQAGVAIGLAATGARTLGGEVGNAGDHHSGVQRALRADRPRLRQAVAVPVRLLLQQAGRPCAHSGYGAGAAAKV